MTITFQNNNDVIDYALEKILSYARNNQYIFLARSVWWISSIIRLQQGLIIHIDNLKNRSKTTVTIVPIVREASAIPRDAQEKSRTIVDLQHIHPDRVSQVEGVIDDISNLDLRNSEGSRVSQLLEWTEQFIQSSQKKRKDYKKQKAPLSRTRSGGVPKQELTKKQRNRLEAIPRDMITEYLAARK